MLRSSENRTGSIRYNKIEKWSIKKAFKMSSKKTECMVKPSTRKRNMERRTKGKEG